MFILYLLIGIVTGLISGLLGLGGGIVVVPALSLIFSKNSAIPSLDVMHMAIGTSLAIMVFTSFSGLYAYHRRAAARWDIVKRVAPSLLVGTLCGTLLANALSSHYLQLFFAIFLIMVAGKILLAKPRHEKTTFLSSQVMYLIAFFIGSLSSILGIGGGTMLVPFFLHCRASLIEAMGASLACGMMIGILASVCFALNSHSLTKIIPSTTGYIYWPAFLGVAFASMLCAPIGSALAHKLPTIILKKIFAMILFIIAGDMLVAFAQSF